MVFLAFARCRHVRAALRRKWNATRDAFSATPVDLCRQEPVDPGSCEGTTWVGGSNQSRDCKEDTGPADFIWSYGKLVAFCVLLGGIKKNMTPTGCSLQIIAGSQYLMQKQKHCGHRCQRCRKMHGAKHSSIYNI